jgi:hypothetical protein
MSHEKRKRWSSLIYGLYWALMVHTSVGRFSPFDENRRFRFSGPIFNNKFQTVQNFEKIKIQLVFNWAAQKVFEPAVFKDGSHNPLIKNKSTNFLIKKSKSKLLAKSI